jgi:pimeloyl-ACP methyl ester carboxylesterase
MKALFSFFSPSDTRVERPGRAQRYDDTRARPVAIASSHEVAALSDIGGPPAHASCAAMSLPLHIESRGSGGLAVVFTHSFAGDVSHWNATMSHLEAQRRVVAIDFSGHGRSPGAIGTYSIAELAKDIGAAVDAAQLTQFVLVGHSMGAAVAAEYAGSHAQRVKALVLVDAPPAPGAIPAEQLQQMHAAVAKDPFPVVEQFWTHQMFIDTRAEVKQRLLTGLRAMTRKAAAELTDASLDYDARPALLRYPGPKFAIVTARNDASSSLHHAVPGFRHVVIRGTGHWIQLDKPDEFNKALDGFLNSL